MLLICGSVLVLLALVNTDEIRQPNIVFIVADDLGWDDVSFHGSDQIMTPNIDTLAYHGIILNQYYTDPEGTASRSAMFTGKYAMRLGTQGSSIRAAEDRGIPVSERLLPQYLRESGYTTHLVGKWSVGKSRAHYHPANRGFNTFYGFLGQSVDYFTYNAIEDYNETTLFGLDLFRGMEAVNDESGHLTELITQNAIRVIRYHNSTKPLYLHISHAAPHIGGGLVTLQPPESSIKANDHIAHSARRLCAGSVTNLDQSIGHIVAALAEKEMLQNTLIIFISDNGAPTVGSLRNFGSNYPLRGTKGTPWDGAVRSVGIVWHPFKQSKIFDGIFHVTDWVPTLVAAAGRNIALSIDGVNQWGTLINSEKSKRNEVLIAIDDLKGWAAYREGDFKIIVGDIDQETSGVYGNEYNKLRHEPPFYDDLLLDCEVVRVFKETLELILDIDLAFIKRADFNLTQYHLNKSIKETCIPNKGKGCLFNISADPLEIHDLWHTVPDIVKHMTLRLRSLWVELKPRKLHPTLDLRANPSRRNYVWFPWLDNDENSLEYPAKTPQFPLQVSIRELQFLVDLNFETLKDQLNVYISGMREAVVKSVSGLFSF